MQHEWQRDDDIFSTLVIYVIKKKRTRKYHNAFLFLIRKRKNTSLSLSLSRKPYSFARCSYESKTRARELDGLFLFSCARRRRSFVSRKSRDRNVRGRHREKYEEKRRRGRFFSRRRRRRRRARRSKYKTERTTTKEQRRYEVQRGGVRLGRLRLPRRRRANRAATHRENEENVSKR